MSMSTIHKSGRTTVTDMHKCPCCDCMTIGLPHCYEICPVCFWEDDGTEDVNEGFGPNATTLGDARRNYATIGACDPNMLRYVRKPLPEEISHEQIPTSRG